VSLGVIWITTGTLPGDVTLNLLNARPSSCGLGVWFTYKPSVVGGMLMFTSVLEPWVHPTVVVSSLWDGLGGVWVKLVLEPWVRPTAVTLRRLRRLLVTHLSTDWETTGTPVYPTDTPVHWLWNYRHTCLPYWHTCRLTVKLPAHLSTLLTHLSTDCETTGTPVYPTDTPVHWLWNYRHTCLPYWHTCPLTVKLPAHLSTLLTHLYTDCETTGRPVYPTDTPVDWLWNYRHTCLPYWHTCPLTVKLPAHLSTLLTHLSTDCETTGVLIVVELSMKGLFVDIRVYNINVQ